MIDLNPHSCLVGFEICGHFFFFQTKKNFIHTVSSQTSSHQNIKKK